MLLWELKTLERWYGNIKETSVDVLKRFVVRLSGLGDLVGKIVGS